MQVGSFMWSVVVERFFQIAPRCAGRDIKNRATAYAGNQTNHSSEVHESPSGRYNGQNKEDLPMPSPYTFSVGDFTCSVVADGAAEYPSEGLLERLDGSPEQMRDALERLHPEGTYRSAMNALLVKTPDGVVLV